MHYDEKTKDYKTIKKYIPDLIAQVRFSAFLAGMKYESFHKIVKIPRYLCTWGFKIFRNSGQFS